MVKTNYFTLRVLDDWDVSLPIKDIESEVRRKNPETTPNTVPDVLLSYFI